MRRSARACFGCRLALVLLPLVVVVGFVHAATATATATATQTDSSRSGAETTAWSPEREWRDATAEELSESSRRRLTHNEEGEQRSFGEL